MMVVIYSRVCSVVPRHARQARTEWTARILAAVRTERRATLPLVPATVQQAGWARLAALHALPVSMATGADKPVILK